MGHVPSTCSRRAATSAAFRRWLLAPKRSSKTLAAGRPHCRTRTSCWKRPERENVHASVGLADVWTVLERGLLLDRLKRARRRDPRRKEMADGAGVRAGHAGFGFSYNYKMCWQEIVVRSTFDLLLAAQCAPTKHNPITKLTGLRAGIHFNHFTECPPGSLFEVWGAGGSHSAFQVHLLV